jgi:hypothetical protein
MRVVFPLTFRLLLKHFGKNADRFFAAISARAGQGCPHRAAKSAQDDADGRFAHHNDLKSFAENRVPVGMKLAWKPRSAL